ncbi:site-specific tyrosine recombinase XerD [Corynebacterium vitaeruminis]|uniref:site-specific tyrosine recombinase XerD n=1 Tax=Corynebacterium vitaeruminis TaxID=38305 RepID=UPI0023F43C30|nr:site-specific tyrosine recombinase XerD [Corynebacterium vitaeruminis]
MPNAREAARNWLVHLTVERGLSQNTLSNYRRDVERYLGYLDEIRIDDLARVTTADVEGYVAYLRTGDSASGRAPLAASSAGRALVVARGLHKFALLEGYVDRDVAAEVSPPGTGRHLPDTLSVEQVSSLIDAIPRDEAATSCDLRDSALLELLYGTGARISEILALNVDDYAKAEDFLLLTGKGSKQRIVPLGSKAKEAVERYLVRARPSLAKGKSHALFLNTRGGALSRQSAWAVLKQAAQRAGITAEISPHTLRHSYATHLLEGGANVRVVQELLGHSSVTTTQIYTHVTAENLRAVWATSHPRA